MFKSKAMNTCIKIISYLIGLILIAGVIVLAKLGMDWLSNDFYNLIDKIDISKLNFFFEFLAMIGVFILKVLVFLTAYIVPLGLGGILIAIIMLIINKINNNHTNLPILIIIFIIYFGFVLFGPQIRVIGSDAATMWKSSMFYSFGDTFIRLKDMKGFFTTFGGFFDGLGVLINFLGSLIFDCLLVLALSFCSCGNPLLYYYIEFE